MLRDGTIKRRTVRSTSKVRGQWATCPKWSTDGKRIAHYLNTKRKLVVMTIDGATQSRRAGDPAIKDFSRDATTLVSPDGALIARRTTDEGCSHLDDVVVSRRDGSGERVIPDVPCSYETAGWSPDSRSLLLMSDIDGIHFTMTAVPVNAPAKATPVVVGVEVNHARFSHVGWWPGHGDVSWQPKA